MNMSGVMEEYLEVFPIILFACYTEQHSMHFVLCLENTSEEESEEMMRVMIHCGAEVTCDIREATEYSIIIVDHEEVVPLHAPAFTVDYITQCLIHKRVLDVSDYRQRATALLVEDDDCMQVVYFRVYNWDATMTAKEKKWIDACAEVSWYSRKTVGITQCESCKRNFVASKITSTNENVESGISAFVKNIINGKAMTSTLIEAQLSDDSSAEEWSVVTTQGSDKVSKHTRTVESAMKKAAQQTKFVNMISDDEDCDGSDGITVLNSKDKESPDLNDEMILKRGKTLHASKACRQWIEASRPDKSSNRINTTTKPKAAADGGESSRKTSPATGWIQSKESSSSPKSPTKWVFPKDFDDDEDDSRDNKKMPKPLHVNKRTRRPYTAEEREQILNYIVQHNEFPRLKGREMWMIMERRKVCQQRTWQSMKEHFLKKIVLELDQYSSLKKEDIRKIKRICF